jgi:hypothetical protein
MTRPSNTAAAATALVAAAALLLAAHSWATEALGAPDATAPTGAVGGARDPAQGTLKLRLHAEDAGAGLANAEATLGGSAGAFVRLGSGACPEHPAPGTEPPPGACPRSVVAFPISLDTRGVPDGSHRLTVRVSDGAANAATLYDREIVVRNALSAADTQATVTIGLTSGSPGDTGGGGNGKGGGKGGGKGAPGPPCRWPRLRMRLLARPLWRTRPGRLPVLRFRRPHLYRGHLTCRVGDKRVRAPEGTPVQIFYRIWRRSFRKRRGPITVRKGTIVVRDGRLQVRLGFLSGRTIIFRYGSPGGGVARSKLRIAIARTDPPRQGQ